MPLNSYPSIITRNANGLNAPIKRHRASEWIKKEDPLIFCLQETHIPKDTFRLKVGGEEPFIMLMDIKRKLE